MVARCNVWLTFVQEYINDTNLEVIEDVANGMAELTGQYQNFSLIGKYLPVLWILYTWYAPFPPHDVSLVASEPLTLPLGSR